MAELFIELFSEEIPANLQIDARKKIKQMINERLSKKEITFNNLNHYRDFLSTSKISKIINLLRKKKFVGVINIASGQETCLKDLATFLSKKKGKEVVFNDNKINTKIIANINKLNKLKWKTKKLNFFNFFD